MTNLGTENASRAPRVPAQDGAVPPFNGGQLRSIVERIEHLHADRKSLADDISEVYTEAKGNGYEPKIIRELIKERALDPSKREETETLLDIYRRALGG